MRGSNPPALLALAGALALAAAPGPAPGEPGFVAAWNRAARDSVVDLDPLGTYERIELSGRLVAADGGPASGVRVYVYHADRRGAYGSARYPDLSHVSGVLLTGPGGGYVIRSSMPGVYEGPPHLHMDAILPPRKRCAWFVNLAADPESGPLPGTMNRSPRRSGPDEHWAALHRDRDGLWRGSRTLHVENWPEQAGLDSIRAGIAARYERAPWRAGHARPRP